MYQCKQLFCVLFALLLLMLTPCALAGETEIVDTLDRSLPETEKWLAYEIDFTSDKEYTDPVYTVDMDVTFTNKHTGTSFTQPAFWCGGTSWKVRVALTEIGEWSYKTTCTDAENAGLHGLEGNVNCLPYTGDLAIYKHGFLNVVEGTRYFMYDDGTPFFYLGDTHWTLALEDIDGIGNISEELAAQYGIESQFKYIMDYRAQQGYTVIQSQPLGWYTWKQNNSHFGDENGTIYEYGVNDLIVEQFNEYDKRFAYIAEKGLVHANSQFSYPTSLMWATFENDNYYAIFGKHFTVEQLEKLCRYWVARYSAYPVMWTTTQEGDRSYYGWGGCSPETNPWLLVMDYIDKYDVYDHPMTCHQENVYSTKVKNSSFGTKEAHDWYAAQYTLSVKLGSTPDFDMLKEYYNNKGAKPVINYEGSYDHFWIGTLGARAQGWVAFLNGNCGYGYGVQPIWSFEWAQEKYWNDPNHPTFDGWEDFSRDLNWVEGLYADAGRQLTYMKELLTEFEWYNLEPCFNGNDYFKPKGVGYSASHIEDELYIIYLYGANNLREHGTFKSMKNGVYELTWFNCRTGERTVEEVTIEDGTFVVPPKPDEYDWAVVLKFKN